MYTYHDYAVGSDDSCFPRHSPGITNTHVDENIRDGAKCITFHRPKDASHFGAFYSYSYFTTLYTLPMTGDTNTSFSAATYDCSLTSVHCPDKSVHAIDTKITLDEDSVTPDGAEMSAASVS